MTMTITTREEYIALFDDPANVQQDPAEHAVNFETILSAGRDYLPPEAIAVLDGEEPTPDYWQFLADQLKSIDDNETT